MPSVTPRALAIASLRSEIELVFFSSRSTLVLTAAMLVAFFNEAASDRFARAAEKTRLFDKQPSASEKEAVDYAFGILSNVAQPGYTQWSIVYDQKRGRIYFRTLQSPLIKSIDTKAFDYSCGSTVRIFDVNSKDSGDVTAFFKDYTREANRDLIERSFNGTEFLKSVPAFVRNLLASYPESFGCAAGGK